uniref:ABC transporter domain-containing protein n=1 Tax=Chromera velia CCMP2878 TaxID=1169474 RepID=A0A0G4I999_9ALVE|eukprot:Cvel_2010.t1-p1 / transcript=Cvel_2010.t1 / gene=Cvel_2010 / organism=Chromera_velia_CCMP2878 / gene_product=ABC transporter G family member 10, putative / transcript_product=ABC transporter G family member 10, putative / location=Cvel_scaffold77:38806-47793(-) / protein_length=1315 / sequence_SO=supercontig / SO=protein_coding / is_pseudo=false
MEALGGDGEIPQTAHVRWRIGSFVANTHDNEETTLLSNIRGELFPGQTLAILGPSGAGKTTFLSLLAGRIRTGRMGGEIFVNGVSVLPQRMRALSSFVEQEDHLTGCLTVQQELTFAADLRVPSPVLTGDGGRGQTDTGGIAYLSEKEHRQVEVERVKRELALSHISSRPIGDIFRRGISGGEKRRVSIAKELVAERPLLFLDEPTSGLDSFTALQVCKSICDLTRKRQVTSCLTIHQPSQEVFELFDRVLFLSGGKAAFFGPPEFVVPFFSHLGSQIPSNTNVGDFVLSLIHRDFHTADNVDLLLQKAQGQLRKLQRHPKGGGWSGGGPAWNSILGVEGGEENGERQGKGASKLSLPRPHAPARASTVGGPAPSSVSSSAFRPSEANRRVEGVSGPEAAAGGGVVSDGLLQVPEVPAEEDEGEGEPGDALSASLTAAEVRSNANVSVRSGSHTRRFRRSSTHTEDDQTEGDFQGEETDLGEMEGDDSLTLGRSASVPARLYDLKISLSAADVLALAATSERSRRLLPKRRKFARLWTEQVSIQVRRTSLIFYRDPVALLVRFFLEVLVKTMMAYEWVGTGARRDVESLGDLRGAMMFSFVVSGFVSLMALPQMTEERRTFVAEQRATLYHPSSYLVSTLVVRLPLLALVCLPNALIEYWAWKLDPVFCFFNFAFFSVLHMCVSFVTEALTLSIAFSTESNTLGWALGVYAQALLLLWSGGFIRVVSMPFLFKLLSLLSVHKWALEGSLLTFLPGKCYELEERGEGLCPEIVTGRTVDGETVLNRVFHAGKFPFASSQSAALLAFLCLFILQLSIFSGAIKRLLRGLSELPPKGPHASDKAHREIPPSPAPSSEGSPAVEVQASGVAGALGGMETDGQRRQGGAGGFMGTLRGGVDGQTKREHAGLPSSLRESLDVPLKAFTSLFQCPGMSSQPGIELSEVTSVAAAEDGTTRLASSACSRSPSESSTRRDAERDYRGGPATDFSASKFIEMEEGGYDDRLDERNSRGRERERGNVAFQKSSAVRNPLHFSSSSSLSSSTTALFVSPGRSVSESFSDSVPFSHRQLRHQQRLLQTDDDKICRETAQREKPREMMSRQRGGLTAASSETDGARWKWRWPFAFDIGLACSSAASRFVPPPSSSSSDSPPFTTRPQRVSRRQRDLPCETANATELPSVARVIRCPGRPRGVQVPSSVERKGRRCTGVGREECTGAGGGRECSETAGRREGSSDCVHTQPLPPTRHEASSRPSLSLRDPHWAENGIGGMGGLVKGESGTKTSCPGHLPALGIDLERGGQPGEPSEGLDRGIALEERLLP